MTEDEDVKENKKMPGKAKGKCLPSFTCKPVITCIISFRTCNKMKKRINIQGKDYIPRIHLKDLDDLLGFRRSRTISSCCLKPF